MISAKYKSPLEYYKAVPEEATIACPYRLGDLELQLKYVPKRV